MLDEDQTEVEPGQMVTCFPYSSWGCEQGLALVPMGFHCLLTCQRTKPFNQPLGRLTLLLGNVQD